MYYEGPGAACPQCNTYHPPEVGWGPAYCENCGADMRTPSVISGPHPDDDVLLDDRYVQFDEIEAFRFLRDAGIVDLFLR